MFMFFALLDSLEVAVLRLDPLGHVLRTFMGVVAQHAAGEVVAAVGIQCAAALFQAGHQCRAMDVLVIAAGQQMAAVFLGLGPAFAVLVERYRSRGHGLCAVFDHARPGLLVAHGLGADGRGDIRCAAEHRVRQLALDAGAEAQGRQADTRGGHDLQGIFGPVHHMKALSRVVQGGGFGRRVGTVDMQLRARQLLADQRPQAVFHP